jgi:serine/threonine protein kinase
VAGEAPTDVPPAAFGRYRVLHQIEVGSLGPVFRGEDPNTHAAVVIKQFRLNLSPEGARKVADGLRALRDGLAQVATPAVIDAGVHRSDPYLVSALANGESLDVALREYGPAAIADALPRLRHLADALDRAAVHGVWHGALQPRDILIDGHDTHMLGLGITPILERAGVRRSTRRPYAAPELMNGDPTSPATDQYALGAIAYEWFFGGRAPISAESVLDAPSLPGVDAEALASALMSALATNPADRFASCREFVEAIDDALATSVLSDDPHEEVEAGAGLLPLEGFEAEEAADHGDDDHELGDRRAPIRPADIPLTDPRRTMPSQRSMTIDPPIAAPRLTPEPVAWQGSLGVVNSPAPPRRATYSAGLLVVALVAGAALGGAAGYIFGTSRVRPTDASFPAANGEVAAANTQPAKEFTDTPVSPAPPTPAQPPPDAARTAVADEPVRTPPPAPPVAQGSVSSRESASLLIRSTPSGAVVAVDGTARGTTPLTLRDVALGTRTIVLSRPGYVPSERRVTLTADRPSRSLDVQLAAISAPASSRTTSRETRPASATTGSLNVDSRPAGSSVTINGQVAGSTPLTIESVAPGTITIRIEKPGYRPWTETIQLKAGERRRVAASLELEPE